MSDIDRLVALCQQGDQHAFERLMQHYQDRIYDLARTILGDETEAKDATQETFLRLYRRIHTFQGRSAFETWLITVATNLCRDRLRRRRLRDALSLDSLTPHWLARLARPADEPDAQFQQQLNRQTIWALVDELDDRLRLPLLLRYRYDLSCGEIGQTLGIATTTVYGCLSEARQRLRKLIEEREATMPFFQSEVG